LPVFEFLVAIEFKHFMVNLF